MSILEKCGVLLPALLTVFTLSVLCCTPASAASPNPILVELFTSEGCSDCPPAETLLRVLDSTQPIPGAQVIALEEHVDYWDDGGWRDPFSSHAFTLRQGEYVDRLSVKNGPYTPQMVVDGSDTFVGNDREHAGRSLAKEVSVPKINVQISSIHVEQGRALAHIATDAVPSKAEVFIAIALDHAQSQVLRGENGGRHLEHVAVVERLTSVGKLKQGESFAKDVAVKLDHPGDAYRAIAFVQEPDQGKVLGAAAAHLQ
jgi:hypothetical protein